MGLLGAPNKFSTLGLIELKDISLKPKERRRCVDLARAGRATAQQAHGAPFGVALLWRLVATFPLNLQLMRGMIVRLHSCPDQRVLLRACDLRLALPFMQKGPVAKVELSFLFCNECPGQTNKHLSPSALGARRYLHKKDSHYQRAGLKPFDGSEQHIAESCSFGPWKERRQIQFKGPLVLRTTLFLVSVDGSVIHPSRSRET